MKSDSKSPARPSKLRAGRFPSDTDRELAVPTEGGVDTTIEEPASSFGFEENIDTEVDFDAVQAVRELEEGMAMPIRTSGEEGKSGQSYTEILESEIEELGALLAEKDSQLQAASDEAEKARERIARESVKQLEQRTRTILLGFLEVLDDLDRALGALRELGPTHNVVDGIELVRKRFLAKLAEHGVNHQPALGERFDPACHDAISTMATDDASKDGVVMAVVREGYAIGDEPLRPASVVVGKA